MALYPYSLFLRRLNNNYRYKNFYQRCYRKMSSQQQYVPTSTRFQPRYTGPSKLTREQETLRQTILESRPRTGLSGPFLPWLAVPKIAWPSQELGKVVRYETSLSMQESELVILLTGAKFKSEAEFDIHVSEALRAGIGIDVINSIPRGTLLSQEGETHGKTDAVIEFSLANVKKCLIPQLEKEMSNEGTGDIQRAIQIVLFTAELLESSTVTDETYATTKRLLGEDDSVLVEIVAIVGYYTYVAFTLNVFRVAT